MNRDRDPRGHYAILGVTPEASAEQIKSAYRRRAMELHPDRNPDGDATGQFQRLNEAYGVLTDTDARKQYDGGAEPLSGKAPEAQRGRAHWRWRVPVLRGVPLLLLIGIAVAMWPTKDTARRTPTDPARETLPVGANSVAVAYQRPDTAPNGHPWPTEAGYLRGYPILQSGGLSQLTIDNGQNDADVFAKLYAWRADRAEAVRHVWIPAHGRFTLTKLAPGNYDLRYRDLVSGKLSQSEPFDLEQLAVDGGTRYTTMTMTIHKVRGGNMATYELPEDGF